MKKPLIMCSKLTHKTCNAILARSTALWVSTQLGAINDLRAVKTLDTLPSARNRCFTARDLGDINA